MFFLFVLQFRFCLSCLHTVNFSPFLTSPFPAPLLAYPAKCYYFCSCRSLLYRVLIILILCMQPLSTPLHRSHFRVNPSCIRATEGNFRKLEDLAISWQLQDLRSNYGVYVVLTGMLSRNSYVYAIVTT